MANLPPYMAWEAVGERLKQIFPEGTENRGYLTRDLAAKTVFSMLYIGAIEDSGTLLGPKHVFKMTEEQAALKDDEDRAMYGYSAIKPGFEPIGKRWYADNTRESIRDETLREGLIRIGAAASLTHLAVTSSLPRYFLKKSFAALFDPALEEGAFEQTAQQWRETHLSAGAQARVRLAGLGQQTDAVRVNFPNGEARVLSAGDSSIISKHVIEEFAVKFLHNSVVLWLSTSDRKVVHRDEQLASDIGLNIESDRNLPDIILVDLRPQDTLLVFVEVVATDGAITPMRQEALYALTDQAGFRRDQVAFVTAYLDRAGPGFRKTISSLAWHSYAWFASEPDNLVHFSKAVTKL